MVFCIRCLIVTPQLNCGGILASNAIVVDKLSKYLKLVELTIVMVLGNVEDERTFSTFNFMRLKLHN
jgi:hypothetical protein